jgi:hypothetical protein
MDSPDGRGSLDISSSDLGTIAACSFGKFVNPNPKSKSPVRSTSHGTKNFQKNQKITSGP